MSKNEELQFVSINAYEEDDNASSSSSYNNDPSSSSSGDNSVLGSWILKQSKHPSAIVFHLLFKTLALFFYMFGTWFTSNFIFKFVICILFLAFDFWTVKNVSGRLLVGLRWWSYVREDGSNDWIFESLEDTSEISNIDSRVFWTALYVTPLIWSFFLFIGVITFDFEDFPLVIAAVSMNMANVYGYTRCSSSAKKRMQSLVEQGLRSTTMAAMNSTGSSVTNWIFNSFLNQDNNNHNNQQLKSNNAYTNDNDNINTNNNSSNV